MNLNKNEIENKDVLHTETENEEKIKREEYNLFRRINTAIRKGNEYYQLCKSRGWREISNFGAYYIVDRYFNTVIDYHLELKNLAEEYNVI